MSSVYFRIEAYSPGNYGCPEYGLMGYTDIEQLMIACWKYYSQKTSKEKQDEL